MTNISEQASDGGESRSNIVSPYYKFRFQRTPSLKEGTTKKRTVAVAPSPYLITPDKSSDQQSNFVQDSSYTPDVRNSFFSSPDDIHTDTGSLNAYGIPPLGNEGIFHPQPQPFESFFDDTFSIRAVSGGPSPDDQDIIVSVDSTPQINNEGFIVNPQPSLDNGGGFSNLQPALPPGQQESFGVALPDLSLGTSDSQTGASDSFGISLGSTSNDAKKDPLGSMTIGDLLMGINGQNGIVVVPSSSVNGVGDTIANNGVTFTLDDDNSKNDNDDIVIVVPTTQAPTTTTTRRSRRTTTRPPDVLRKTLSDLWFSKGQWFGTLLGGMIDMGKIAAEAFRNHTSLGSSSPSYSAPQSLSSSSENDDIFALI